MQDLLPLFPFWTIEDVEDHVSSCVAMGKDDYARFVSRGLDFAEAIQCATSPEEYDAYRVAAGCISCLRTITRKWDEMRADPMKSYRQDIAVMAVAFPN